MAEYHLCCIYVQYNMLPDLQGGFSPTGCEIGLVGLSNRLKSCRKMKILMTAYDGMVQQACAGYLRELTVARDMTMILWLLASLNVRWRWCYPEA